MVGIYKNYDFGSSVYFKAGEIRRSGSWDCSWGFSI